jgi:hypothetical protein
MNHNMFNKLCKICVNSCKQEDTVKIVTCPKFHKKPSEKEFHLMVGEIDKAEKQAKSTQKRVKEIIKSGLAKDINKPDETGFDKDE